MNGTLSDACGTVIAALLGIPFVLLPGYALGTLTGILGFGRSRPANACSARRSSGSGSCPPSTAC